ncbi:unnamed protein product [Pseudo-nitzschia multistriata]|uniref:Uncharacterized protein n=1 Tax=Pseudo-nitzschia multistriata TaxID=183589 RepID=A0A448ZSL3_9STRA|nr:unnamed protein product [Pseudo-nitzschia multistriata]
MPRGARSGSKKGGVTNGPPPSLPAETFREHRKFLIRSLDRNDVEMSALNELNKTLHKARDAVLQSCGELVLLDLGSGRLKLVGEQLHEEPEPADSGASKTELEKIDSKQHDLTQAQKQICVDFLLRMNLRRKLSNRLVRRLTRLAYVMDGKDLSPPGPPKYGDLRLQIDPKALQLKAEEWGKKEEAKKRIETAILLDVGSLDRESSSNMTKQVESIAEKKEPYKDEASGKSETEETRNSPDETKSGGASKEIEAMDCSSPTETEKHLEIDCRKAQEGSDISKQYYTLPALANEYNVLKEYDTAYDKLLNPSDNSFKYLIANEELSDPQPGKIGVSAYFSNPEDLKTEYKRWQTNMSRRIPQQSSIEEFGLKNRVFHLEERRKRCIEAAAIDGETTCESPVKKIKLEQEKDGESNNQTSPTRKEANNDGSENMEIDEDETKGGGNSDSEDEQGKQVERIDPILEAMKNKRSISFAPTPSFRDQDLSRIRLIHKDLLQSSQVALTNKRLKVASDDYSKACHFSTQLFEARQMVQHNLTFAIAKGRQEIAKAHSDYTIAYTNAKQRWIKEKFEYDMKKSQAILPTKWGNRPIGTQVIGKYVQANYSNLHRATVGQTLADIVDGSILVGEGKANIQPFRDFQPPPAPGMNAQTGENMAQRQTRVEMEYRKQYSDIDAKLQKSEAERARAWRNVMKAQAENNSVCGQRGSKVTLANYRNIPVPVMRASVQQNRKSQMMQQRQRTQATAPAKAPAPIPATSSSTVDMSKYSAEKVKLRKAADGSVAPVSKPKKDKDGLYLRPAGRTRKGMQWDAVNGVWIPQQQPK